MTIPSEYSALSLYVYNAKIEVNKPLLPVDWEELDITVDNALGFSYGVFRRIGSTEVVVAFAGTNQGIDWVSNVTNSAGLSSTQTTEAALAYLTAKAQYGDNITLTGHSLGGGLASVMAVWFDRPAVVFDEAPFELTARNPFVIDATYAALITAGFDVGAFAGYTGLFDFSAREAQVTNYYASEEALQLLRMVLPTVVGADNRIEFGVDNMLTRRVDLHSQALLTAGLMSDAFANATVAVQRALPLLMDKSFYAYDAATSDQQNVLINFIRSEQGTGDKLSHFANDLNKLGTNLAGLNKAAQDALIAQGIEWYYWQGTDYAGQEFFTESGGALQYTVNAAEPGSLNQSANKALQYVSQWLDPLMQNGGNYSVAYKYDEWNVAAGTGGATATARNADQTQIFIGNTGADTFTGGNEADLIAAGAGNDTLKGGGGLDHIYAGEGDDTLDGGAGGDWLYGGIGNDSYQLKSGELFDVINDSDGNGSISVDGTQLTGGKKAAEGYWLSDDKQWGYSLTGSGDLVISKGSGPGRIVVRDWQANGGSKLGITLNDSPVEESAPSYIKNGDQHGEVLTDSDGKQYYRYSSYAADGTLINGVPEVDFDDVLYAYGVGTTLNGFGGNDSLGGYGGDDIIDGGTGDDFIGGGGGSDQIFGGTGDDLIYSSSQLYVYPRYSPGEVWPRAGTLSESAVITSAHTSWGTFRNLGQQDNLIWGVTLEYWQANGDVVDAGAGNDSIHGSYAGDHLDGGAGADFIIAAGGDDIIDGGEGNDWIYADGIVNQYTDELHTYFSFLPAQWHGRDFIDGGSGADAIYGEGNADILYGGTGDDYIFGDVAGQTDYERYVAIEFQGADYLDGEEGNDYLVGGAKDDFLFGGAGSDILWGDASASTIVGNANGQSAADLSLLAYGNDYLDGEDGNDRLFGGGKDDVLYGGTGNDYLFGDERALDGEYHGSDSMDGEEGDDQMVGGGGADTLFGGAGNDTLLGDDDIEDLAADFHGEDHLDGEEGDDILLGQGGADTLVGGEGNDILIGDSGEDGSLDVAFQGNDLLDGGAGNDKLYGEAGNDTLLGGDGNDELNSGDGNDTLNGGLGNDRFGVLRTDGVKRIIDEGGVDRLILTWKISDLYIGLGSLLLRNKATGAEVHIEGFDINDPFNTLSIEEFELVDDEGNAIVLSAAEFLALGLEHNQGTPESDAIIGTLLADRIDAKANDDTVEGREGGDYIWGGNGNDVLLGQQGNDLLNGGDGADILLGGADNDTLFGDGGDDRVEGEDGNDSLDGGLGNDLLFGALGNDVLRGADGDDQLDGGEGDDQLYGGGGNDVLRDLQGIGELYGEAGDDLLLLGDAGGYLSGGDGDDQLLSGAGNNRLEGDAGADRMAGGADDDIYVVENIGDVIVENVNEGLDLVLASVDYTLSANIENLTFESRRDEVTYEFIGLTGVGNALDNVLTGDHGHDMLYGMDGVDTLYGMYGNDSLYGMDGNDILDAAINRYEQSGDEADLLVGGAGDDLYIVDSAADLVVEGSDGGTDTVYTYSTYTALSENVEDLVIHGEYQADFYNLWRQYDGDGNSLNNFMQGNDARNWLNGFDGDDRMDGAAGDDAIYGGSGNDILSGGSDSAFEENSESVASWATNNDYIDGGAGNDKIDGGSGNDIVLGGDGADVLYGGDNRLASINPVLANEAVQSIRRVIDSGMPAARTLDMLLTTFGFTQDSAALNHGYYAYSAWQLSATPGVLPQAVDLYIPSWQEGEPQPSEAFYIQPDGTLTWEGGGAFQENQLANWNPMRAVSWPDLVMQYGVRADLIGVDANLYAAVSTSLPIPSDHFDPDPVMEYQTVYWPRASLPDSVQFDNLFLMGMDTLDGGAGDDSLDGGGGNDVLRGGEGSDVLYGGNDESFDLRLQGWAGSGVIDFGVVAAPNNDYLDGGTGIDTLIGGSGDDTYIVDGTSELTAGGAKAVLELCDGDSRFGMDRAPARAWTSDVVIENAGEGHDTVYASASVVLDNVETVLLEESAAILDIDATTGSGSQELVGNSGDNRLDGGADADLMRGGAGDDTYLVDSVQDVVVELAGGGFDTVRTSVDGYALGDELEGMVLEGSAVSGAGNSLDNVLVGNALDNRLSGSDGNDTLAGWRGNDALIGGAGDDTYAFSRGDGADIVFDTEGAGALHFGEGIAFGDLAFSRDGDDLVVNVLQGGVLTGDRMLLSGWMVAPERVNSLQFCDSAVVVLDESLLNRAPVALSDNDQVTEDVRIGTTGNILTNDSDPNPGQILTLSNPGIYAGVYGSLQLNSDGSYQYVLNNSLGEVQALAVGQTLSEQFSYSVTDSAVRPLSASSTLGITIHGSNDGPVAIADLATAQEDRAVEASGNVLVNDSDIDTGDILSVADAGVRAGAYGTLDLAVDGSYRYALNNAAAAVQALRGGQQVTDNFGYSATDGLASAADVLQVNVVGSNDAPVAFADAAFVQEDGIVLATGNVLANDSDVDQATLLRVGNAGRYQGQWGVLTLSTDGSYSYALNNADPRVQSLGANATLNDNFSYTVVDDDALNPLTASSSLSITITGSNDGPVARADAASVTEDSMLQASGNVLINDSDIDTSDTLAVVNVGSYRGQYGSLSLTADGAYAYTLNNADTQVQSLAAGQTVTESFDYTARDNSAQPATSGSQILITVAGTNDGPVLDAPLADRAVSAGQPVSFSVPAGAFSDIDQGDVLSYSAQVLDSQGKLQALPAWLSFDALTRSFSGSSALAGNLNIRVTATDLSGATASDVFNLAVVEAGTTGKGNEGLGNGQDAPPPGHTTNWNDGPGTSPGNPGSRGGRPRTAVLTLADASSASRDQILQNFWDGGQTVISSTSYVLPAHMRALILSGSGAINATGNALANWLVGNAENNMLSGGSGGGVDILQGGHGNDQISDAGGNNLLDGGLGNDTLSDGVGASRLYGGKGNDHIEMGSGADLLGFNRGDGNDVVTSQREPSANDVLSLGGGIRYADLRLVKRGADLVLDVGAGESLTFSKWYAGRDTSSIGKLQVVTVGGDYDAASGDKTRNRQVEVFDFGRLVQAFDAARAAQAGNANGWSVMNSLLDAHLQGSDTAALGGDLSYQYATSGSLAGIGLGAAQASLSAGTDWHNLQSRGAGEQGSARIM